MEALVRLQILQKSLQRRDRELAPLINYLEQGILPEEDAQTRFVLATTDQYVVTHEGLLYHISSNTLGWVHQKQFKWLYLRAGKKKSSTMCMMR